MERAVEPQIRQGLRSSAGMSERSSMILMQLEQETVVVFAMISAAILSAASAARRVPVMVQPEGSLSLLPSAASDVACHSRRCQSS
jgi:hypothetical protein